jgi:iron complex outermembrane recepter protein
MRGIHLATGSVLAIALASPLWAQQHQPAAVAGSAPVTAPDAAPQGEAPQDIIVTGQRAALASAQNIRRDAPQIVDSIVAQDIGKFPDNAVSDSLQRITGVQVFRDSGETNRVVIRGLPNVISELNGREIFTGSGRTFAFQDLPAEAVAQLNVFKTSTADLIEGGIAGTVNIDLHKPFDFKGFSIAATARGEYSRYAKKVNPIAGLLVSDRWQTGIGEIGLLVDLSYRKQYYNQPASFSDPRYEQTISGNDFLVSNAVGGFYTRGHRQRPQANFALQWKPADNLEIYVDGLYAKYKETREIDYYFGVPGTAQSVTNLQLYSASDPGGCEDLTGTTGTRQVCELKSGTFVNPYVATSTQAFKQSSHDAQISGGGKWSKGGLKLTTDLTYTDSSFKEKIFIIDTSLPNQTFDLVSNSGGHILWNLQGNDKTNADLFQLQGLFQTGDSNHGNSLAWRGDLSYDFDDGLIRKLQFGARVVRRKAGATGETQISTPFSKNGAPLVSATSVFGSGFFRMLPDYLGFAGISPAQTPDINYLFAHEGDIREAYGLSSGDPAEDPSRFYAAIERSYAGYAQASYGFDLGGISVDGLAGVRVVQNNRDINAYQIAFNTDGTSSISPVSARTQDTDVLPNASIRAHLTNKLQARFSYTKTATRPDFGSLNPSLTLNPPTLNRLGYGSTGNPQLREIRSDNIDASVEWFFGRSSSITATYFHRSIDGYIQTYGVAEVIGGVPYTISQPESAGKGTLKGVEVAYQQFYDFLPGPLSGLGLQLNYTRITGSTQAPLTFGGAAVNQPLGNVSKDNGNAVLMYEKYGISGRLAYNYRGKFVDSFNPGGVQTPAYNVIKSQSHLDLSMSYDVTRNITVTFDATNLTGARAYEYLGTPLLPQNVRLEDKTYSFGARAKF